MNFYINGVLLILAIIGCVYAENNDRCTATYFPLEKNSYWVYKDSAYDIDDEEDVSPSFPIKDSITDVKITDTGIIADVIKFSSKQDGIDKITMQYLQKDNMVYWRMKEKNKWCQWEIYCEIYPYENDTIIKGDKIKRSYKGSKYLDNDAFILINVDPNSPKLTRDIKEFYVKNVGYIGTDFCSFSHNLIEYRIGNGPIVKRNWLLEKVKK